MVARAALACRSLVFCTFCTLGAASAVTLGCAPSPPPHAEAAQPTAEPIVSPPASTPVDGPGPSPASSPASSSSAQVEPSAPPPVAVVPTSFAQEDQQRKQLEDKALQGKATVDEIKMLKAICFHLRNRECRERADALLKKQEQPEQKREPQNPPPAPKSSFTPLFHDEKR